MAYGDQPRGIINITTASLDVSDGGEAGQVMFKRCYDAFEHWRSQTWCNRVSLQYGSGGSGTDYFDGVAPFGDNAFFVYQFPPSDLRKFSFYVLVQYAGGAVVGSAPGNPGLLSGGSGDTGGNILVQFALAATSSGADASPWNGTTNFDGSDTKGTPVWEAPVSGHVHVWPRSNNTGGSHATNRENGYRLLSRDEKDVTHRAHFVSDGDFISLVCDELDNNDNPLHIMFGPYKYRNDILNACPFVSMLLYRNANSSPLGYGTLAGNTLDEGGVLLSWDDQVLAWEERPSASGAPAQTSLVQNIGTEVGEDCWPVDIFVTEGSRLGLVGRTYSRFCGYLRGNNGYRNQSVPATPPYMAYVHQRTTIYVGIQRALFFCGNEEHFDSSTRDGVLV